MTHNSDDISLILKDTAIYRYVAGELSGSELISFEEQLKLDDQLRQDVEVEKHLREELNNIASSEKKSKPSFDALLEKIEQQEAPLTKNKGNIVAFPSAKILQFAMAACLVVVVGVGYFFDLTEPKFNVLSDNKISANVDFSTLAHEGRIAKLVFSTQLTESEVDQLLEQYQLHIFKTNIAPSHVYAFMDKAISESDISTLKSDKRVQAVEIFLVGNEK